MTFYWLSPCQERRGVFSCWGPSWNGSHHSAIPWFSLVIIVHSTNSISDSASQADNHVHYINSKLSSPEELYLTIMTKRYLDLRFYHCKISLLGIKIKYAYSHLSSKYIKLFLAKNTENDLYLLRAYCVAHTSCYKEYFGLGQGSA